MDPISLIVAAIVAGASAGVSETASDAVKTALGSLRERIASLFKGNEQAKLSLAAVAEGSDVDGAAARALDESLRGLGQDPDRAAVAAAQELLGLVDPHGASEGKYTVDLRDAKGVQVGDGNTQQNTFN